MADQIAAIPPNDASAAKTVNSDRDKGIEKNLHAALTHKRLQKAVKYDVKNGVVTLTGKVNSQSQRAGLKALDVLTDIHGACVGLQWVRSQGS